MPNVRRLMREDYEAVLALFGKQLGNYYFLIHDMNLHHENGMQGVVYGEYEGDRLASILLHNANNVTYFSLEDRDAVVYRDTLEQLAFSKISGPSSMVERLLPHVHVRPGFYSHMGVVNNISASRRHPDIAVQAITTQGELGEQFRLLSSAHEFDGFSTSEEEYVGREWSRLLTSSARTLYLRVNGQMAASASTVREGDKSAIIVGVITHPQFRNAGYGTDVLIELFGRLLQEGKHPYLFYSNPAARRVYQKIGMTEVCEWQVVHTA